MRGKKACIVADLRTGQHMQHIPDVVAVLSAAGWKTDIALKEYGGETLQLAQKAAHAGYDLVIGYGGDGTLNAVFNGIVNAGGKSLVADVPGGTYNVWAGAIGVPSDPVKAALAIVNSKACTVDLGHVEVASLTFPQDTHNTQPSSQSLNGAYHKKPKQSSKVRQHFLLNVGIGIDATIMAHTSKPLKYHLGALAIDLSALKELPEQRPFPVELQVMDSKGHVQTHWQGNAWEVFVSKVPLLAGEMNLEPDARADDGLLYVSLITANGPLKTLEQAFSILTQHKLDKDTTQRFCGTHFSLRIPATIAMHMDGSIVKLEEFLHKAEWDALQHTSDAGPVMVDYHFDAKPKAVQLAIPRTYDGSLFSRPLHEGKSQDTQSLQREATHRQNGTQPADAQPNSQQHLSSSQEQEYRVVVIGVAPIPEQHGTYIVAGRYKKQETDETQVVAVRINSQTLVFNSEDKAVSPATALELKEGQELVVIGDKTKRSVIRAQCVKYSH